MRRAGNRPLSIVGPLHPAASAKKLPRLSGAVLLGRGRTRPGSARLGEPRRFYFGSGRFGESAGTIRRRGRKNSALWPMAHVTRRGGGKRRDTSAIREALLGPIGSRGGRPSARTTFRPRRNIAAIAAGRFQSQLVSARTTQRARRSPTHSSVVVITNACAMAPGSISSRIGAAISARISLGQGD